MSRLTKQTKKEDFELTECDKIKEQLETLDLKLEKNGGINCGWVAADHKDFLRIRTKHSNKTGTVAFFNEMMRAVVDLDQEKI